MTNNTSAPENRVESMNEAKTGKVFQVEKEKIKGYWETRAPQVWYSDHEPMTLQWFNEIAYQRYNVYYAYVNKVAEFDAHGGEKVLEIGVGVGTDLASFAKQGARVSGVDLTENAIEVTKEHFRILDLKYDELLPADAEKLPFPDNSFDVVYSFGVLHHTPRTDLAIREVHRVLNKNGKAIIMLYSRGWKHYFKRLFIKGVLMGGYLKMTSQEILNKNSEVEGNSPLTYVKSKKEIRELFEQFSDVEIKKHRLGEYFDYAPYKTKKLPGPIVNFFRLIKLERLWGENYIIKARKAEKKENPISFWQTFLMPYDFKKNR